jgi:hypothetical protein
MLLEFIQDLSEEIYTERREGDAEVTVSGVWILLELGRRIALHFVLVLLNFILMRRNFHFLLSRHFFLLKAGLY